MVESTQPPVETIKEAVISPSTETSSPLMEAPSLPSFSTDTATPPEPPIDQLTTRTSAENPDNDQLGKEALQSLANFDSTDSSVIAAWTNRENIEQYTQNGGRLDDPDFLAILDTQSVTAATLGEYIKDQLNETENPFETIDHLLEIGAGVDNLKELAAVEPTIREAMTDYYINQLIEPGVATSPQNFSEIFGQIYELNKANLEETKQKIEESLAVLLTDDPELHSLIISSGEQVLQKTESAQQAIETVQTKIDANPAEIDSVKGPDQEGNVTIGTEKLPLWALVSVLTLDLALNRGRGIERYFNRIADETLTRRMEGWGWLEQDDNSSSELLETADSATINKIIMETITTKLKMEDFLSLVPVRQRRLMVSGSFFDGKHTTEDRQLSDQAQQKIFTLLVGNKPDTIPEDLSPEDIILLEKLRIKEQYQEFTQEPRNQKLKSKT